MPIHTRLRDLYRFPGFQPAAHIHGRFGAPLRRRDPAASRRQKTACGACGTLHRAFYDQSLRFIRDLEAGGRCVYLHVPIRCVACRSCEAVKRERLDWITDNPRYTHRFAVRVGRYCRLATVKDVAEDLHLDWHAVKNLDKL